MFRLLLFVALGRALVTDFSSSLKMRPVPRHCVGAYLESLVLGCFGSEGLFKRDPLIGKFECFHSFLFCFKPYWWAMSLSKGEPES
jgi:hypothetical protein